MKRSRISFLCGCLLTFVAAVATAADQNEDVLGLEKDLRALSAQISQAESESSKYPDGLIKSLILYRVQVLRNTRAMLEQKRYALTYKIPLSHAYTGEIHKPYSPDRALIRALESEIKHQQAELAKIEAENAKYPNEITQVMTLSQMATIKNTIAILEQKLITEKYGIPLLTFPAEEFQQAKQEKKPAGATV